MAIELGPSSGTLTVHTSRAGMAAKAGHDLDIVVERWSATLDPAAGSFSAEIDPSSLRVQDGHGGVKALSDGDRKDIAKTLGEKILKTAQNRQITYQSTSVSGLGSPTGKIDGKLTLVGVSLPIAIPVSASSSGDETTLTAVVPLIQSRFGIKPYSAMMGALKVADSVEIRASVTVPTSALT